MIEQGEKYLITVKDYFIGNEGQQFKAIWGKAEIAETAKEVGFNIRSSANWVIKMKDPDKDDQVFFIIPGCQFQSAQRMDKKPNEVDRGSWTDANSGKYIYNYPVLVP